MPNIIFSFISMRGYIIIYLNYFQQLLMCKWEACTSATDTLNVSDLSKNLSREMMIAFQAKITNRRNAENCHFTLVW